MSGLDLGLIEYGAETGYQIGYQHGLDAAREAVAALDPPCSGLCECLPDTLAAIDALKEKP